MEDKPQLTLEEIRQQCINSYALFCHYMQDDGYFDPVHEELCHWTQYHVIQAEREVENTGECLLELAYIMPRGSLKSTIITKLFSAWIVVRRFYLFHDSSTRILIAGNTFDNASAKMSKDLGGLYETNLLFRTLFPEILPLGSNDWNSKRMEINRTGSFPEGTYECAGTNTKLIGRHYNGIIEDDTTAPDISDMKSEIVLPSNDIIQQAIGFHQAGQSLLIPKGFIFRIVVSTRWACEDLIQYIQEIEKYKYFNKSAMNELGKPNFSCFYNEEKLATIKSRIGSFMFSMLYLNKPLDNSQRIFNPEHFNYINAKDVPRAGFFTIALDPAISEKAEACDSSITVNQHIRKGYQRHEFWWEDCNVKLLPFQLVNKTLDIADEYTERFAHLGEKPIKAIIVETNAYQYALKQIFENEMERRGVRYSIYPMQSRTKKELRIQSMQPSFEEGRIHFVRTSTDPSRNKLSLQTESQLKQFPNGKLVDTIDSWSMHRIYIRKDDKKDTGYLEEQELAKAEEDPIYKAILEIRATKKKKSNITLSPPTLNLGEGLSNPFRYKAKGLL